MFHFKIQLIRTFDKNVERNDVNLIVHIYRSYSLVLVRSIKTSFDRR